jgi:hypothetical protein
MRLDPRAFGFAAGIVAVILFAVCAFAVAIAPEFTTVVGGYLLHADLSSFTRSLTWGNFIGGLLGWGIGTAIVFALVATLYNRLGAAQG